MPSQGDAESCSFHDAPWSSGDQPVDSSTVSLSRRSILPGPIGIPRTRFRRWLRKQFLVFRTSRSTVPVSRLHPTCWSACRGERVLLGTAEPNRDGPPDAFSYESVSGGWLGRNAYPSVEGHGAHSARSQARRSTAFREYSGLRMLHCQILDHEDLGMMGTIDAAQLA